MSYQDFHELTVETARNYWNFNQTRAKAVHFAVHLELLDFHGTYSNKHFKKSNIRQQQF